jgi:hypothetical protein
MTQLIFMKMIENFTIKIFRDFHDVDQIYDNYHRYRHKTLILMSF